MSDTPPSHTGASESADEASFEATALSASLTVNDVHTSLTWYRQLGFVVDRKHEHEGRLLAVSLVAGAVRILLNQDDGEKGWQRVKGEGFSLQITTAQDVDAIADRIRSRGFTLASEPADMPWGARMFRLQDPDGFKLAISSERRPPPATDR
ncbi:MAG: VOC family protein [Gemmatimonadota bacterium]